MTVFFKAFPDLIDWSKAPLPSSPAAAAGELKIGGGGGGGAGIFLHFVLVDSYKKLHIINDFS